MDPEGRSRGFAQLDYYEVLAIRSLLCTTSSLVFTSTKWRGTKRGNTYVTKDSSAGGLMVVFGKGDVYVGVGPQRHALML